jgi:hypothetical protein
VEPIHGSTRPSDELKNLKLRRPDEYNETGFSSLIVVGDWVVVVGVHIKFSTNFE